jgi:hypothetical protein
MFLAWRYYSVNSTGMNDPEYPRGEIHKYNTCPGSVHHTYGHIYVQTLFGYICGYGNPNMKRAEDVPCVKEPDVKNALAQQRLPPKQRTLELLGFWSIFGTDEPQQPPFDTHLK